MRSCAVVMLLSVVILGLSLTEINPVNAHDTNSIMISQSSVARKLTDGELTEAIAKLSGWSVEQGKLHKQFVFKDFVAAFAFMTKISTVAEAMSHHPEWCNVYNKLVIDLVTHDVGGISTLDIELAQKIDAL